MSSGRFEPGHPGGPGRPAGSRNKATLALDAIADGEAKTILQKQIELAKEGDQRAAEVILSRAWPARKSRAINLDLPPVTEAADIVPALGRIADAVAGGEITPDGRSRSRGPGGQAEGDRDCRCPRAYRSTGATQMSSVNPLENP